MELPADLLKRGIKKVIDKESLLRRLKAKSLRIKFGVDPTSPNIHLGQAVTLRKLAQLQALGHQIIFLIGDFTATIGDPSGAKKTRPILTKEEVEKNAQTYLKQVGKILDVHKTEIQRNSKWYSQMSLAQFFQIKSLFSLQRILERDDFSQRLKNEVEIGLHEIDYPVLQAYDSVVLKVDLEVGGSDQEFNLLAGRRLMKQLGLAPQEVVMTELLVGTDGQKKMSKSLGNAIGICEPANQMYGKIMSLDDSLLPSYWELCTDLPLEKLNELKNPRDQKAYLAFEIVKIYHGRQKAEEAAREFERVFQKGLPPSQMSEFVLQGEWSVFELLPKLKLTQSKSEARRLVEQKGVKIGGRLIEDANERIQLKDGLVVQVGRRRFAKIKTKE